MLMASLRQQYEPVTRPGHWWKVISIYISIYIFVLLFYIFVVYFLFYIDVLVMCFVFYMDVFFVKCVILYFRLTYFCKVSTALSRTGLAFAVSPSTGKTEILKMSRKWQDMILLDDDSDEKWSLFQKQFNNWTLEILNRRTSRDAACTMIIGKDAPLGPSCVKVHLYDHHWSDFFDETAFTWAFFLRRRFVFPSVVVSSAND